MRFATIPETGLRLLCALLLSGEYRGLVKRDVRNSCSDCRTISKANVQIFSSAKGADGGEPLGGGRRDRMRYQAAIIRGGTRIADVANDDVERKAQTVNPAFARPPAIRRTSFSFLKGCRAKCSLKEYLGLISLTSLQMRRASSPSPR